MNQRIELKVTEISPDKWDVRFFPLLILIALLIKLEDGGPVLFKQERIGLNGRRFTCYKFRSMVMNAEELITDLLDMNE